MSEEIKILKTIIPSTCPNCNKEIFVNYQMMPPSLVAIVKRNEISKAKEDFILRLDEIKFKDNAQKEGITKWINDPNTLFTLPDVDDMVKQILMDQGEKAKDKK